MSAAARLDAVAGWDVPDVGRAVATLADVSERLLTWRARLERLGREIGAPGCWTGPAAQQAAASVAELSCVAWAVDSALGRSSDAFRRLVSEARAAHELAVAAGAMSRLVPGAASPLADAALQHADGALAAARDAEAELSSIGADHGAATLDFWGLLAHVPIMGPFVPPEVPDDLRPAEAAAWWASLAAGAQQAVIWSYPTAVGSLDGVPAWARDRANRLLLSRALADPDTPDDQLATARAVAGQVAAAERRGRHVQVHLLDLSGDLVALAFGDLDTADAVAVTVPGIFNTAADDLSGLTGDTLDLADATRAADPGMTVAAMMWLGYRTPSNLHQAAVRANAERGGKALARALDGLTAARRAVATPAPRTTVVAHSYGTYVVDEAADEPGELAADAVVLLGSPGMEDDAASLEAPEVFDAATPADVITWATAFGEQKSWEGGYGATELPTDFLEWHWGYYDRDHPTLAAMGEVVAGTRAPD